MIPDNELRKRVEDELGWEPSIDDRRIGVSVVDGIVTLTGEVSSYGEKWKVERVVERVAGVRGVANDLEVRSKAKHSDTEIAHAAAEALKWDIMVPSDRITVAVDKGWLTLRGDVSWDFQRRAAERAVRNLAGVKGITNLITIKPRVAPEDIKQKIEESFRRAAAYDVERVIVNVSGGEVTLRGTVRSWAERHEAEKAAWAAPGVTKVNNLITVQSEESAAA